MESIYFEPIINEAKSVNLGASDYYINNNLEPDNEYMKKYLEIKSKPEAQVIDRSKEKLDIKAILDRFAPKTSVLNTVKNTDASQNLYANSGEKINLSKGETGNAKKAINYLMSKEGLSKEQATAIAANLHVESGFNTAIIGDTNLGKGQEALGIAQWRLDRKDNMLNFLKKKNISPTSFEGQLSFLTHELKTGSDGSGGKAWRAMQNSTDVGQLASDFDKYYERSDGKARNKRITLARKLYNS